ncbi:phage major capsid protein [Priestia aryabhattai]|uniref:phage major capsid family protein n=1 Tax=Priestia aryabhattai TaxID=412384 RepID=UPI003983329A
MPFVTINTNPTEEMLCNFYLEFNSGYRFYCKWYMSEGYYEKVSKIIVNGEYLVKSKNVNGKVITNLWEHEIEISSAMESGTKSAELPIVFTSIADCYILAISKDIEVEKIIGTAEALNDSVSFKGEALLDGGCHNYNFEL